MKISINIIFITLLFVGFSLPVYASDLVTFSTGKQQETITLTLPETEPHKIFTVPNPDRLVIDIPALPGRHAVSLPDNYKGKWIKALRFGQFNPTTSRFVFDLGRQVRVVRTRIEGKKPVRLIVEIAADDASQDLASTMPMQKNNEKPIGQAPAAPNKKTSKSSKKPSNAKPVIVIDPGHGGVDPGTIGADGAYEKDIVLSYAKALRAKLQKSGKYTVVITREDDRFIMLRKRVEIARKAGGALFISLHADSASEQMARGLSVYTLSEKASDQEAEALAARENKSDVIAGMDLSEERKEVADILISLAQRETKNLSATLADQLVSQLNRKVVLLTNSHRFAGFAVLKAPDIPSVLVEIGFLSHPGEEKMLKSAAYREKVVSGLSEGIDAYFRQKQSIGE